MMKIIFFSFILTYSKHILQITKHVLAELVFETHTKMETFDQPLKIIIKFLL